MELPARVLVVDDELIVCQSCARILAEDGHQVAAAQTGEEALQKVQEDLFDVVLLDLRLPGCGGLRLLRALREASPQTEVIVLTGYPTLESAKEAIRLGALEYVTKPVRPEILRTVVAQIVACKCWRLQEGR
ncbi:MAG: response regulator [Planctomycetes bacterium]|nr:response regulator [Planctomycetota bacterium]